MSESPPRPRDLPLVLEFNRDEVHVRSTLDGMRALAGQLAEWTDTHDPAELARRPSGFVRYFATDGRVQLGFVIQQSWPPTRDRPFPWYAWLTVAFVGFVMLGIWVVGLLELLSGR